MIGTIVKIRRKCWGHGRSESLGLVEKIFSSFDSELRFLAYSLHSFINEFMEVRAHEVQGTGHLSGSKTTHEDLGNTHRAVGRGRMEEWNTQWRPEAWAGAQRWDLFFVALPASFWLWDELASLGFPITSSYGESQTSTSPSVSTVFTTAWLHRHILSGLTIHLWMHYCWKIP